MGFRNALRRYPWWGILFFAIGVLATLAVLAFLFAGMGRRPAAVAITAPAAAGSDEFLLALSGAVSAPVREGGRVELLSNGVEFFPSLLQSLGGAQRSINFMVYIWEPGVVSDTVFDVLVQRARAGVQVRVMLDGFGAQNAPEERIDELRAAGGQVVFFRPLRIWSIDRFHRRNHRRAIVVDGEVGFTGGALVGDKWLGDAQTPDFWRDDMVRVTGALARSLQAAFAQLWSNSTGEILAGAAFYPPEPESAGPGEAVARHLSVVSSPSEENLPLRK
ncbi:MAG: phospholipase D-like domain-containing protein, partial [Gemmatimonadota bacterium]|nr:phospholipase D-like domain-containing protein [Gemmatimonadota bacterium]